MARRLFDFLGVLFPGIGIGILVAGTLPHRHEARTAFEWLLFFLAMLIGSGCRFLVAHLPATDPSTEPE